jgi:hypothetical protein
VIRNCVLGVQQRFFSTLRLILPFGMFVSSVGSAIADSKPKDTINNAYDQDLPIAAIGGTCGLCAATRCAYVAPVAANRNGGAL